MQAEIRKKLRGFRLSVEMTDGWSRGETYSDRGSGQSIGFGTVSEVNEIILVNTTRFDSIHMYVLSKQRMCCWITLFFTTTQKRSAIVMEVCDESMVVLILSWIGSLISSAAG